MDTDKLALFVIAEKADVAKQHPAMPEDHIKDEVMMRLARKLKAAEATLQAIVDVAPTLPKVHRWTGTAEAESLFDLGLRHKSGLKPFDYLKAWLGMLRPFAYATQDDSWGEMEKHLTIVMRNYVRVAEVADKARAALSPARGEE